MDIHSSLRQPVATARAFVHMGWRAATSYPIGLVLTSLLSIVPIFTAYFINRLIQPSNNSIGQEYFVFVALGVLAFIFVNRIIMDFTVELDSAIQQGRLEMFLIEPIPWRALPVGLALWPAVLNVLIAALVLVLTIALGAHYRLAGVGPALVIVLLGVVSAIGIGILTGSVRVLAKKSDPVSALYNIATTVLAGLWYPVGVLPKGLRLLAWSLPTMYANSGLRKAMMPHARSIYGPNAVQAIVGLLVLNAILYPFALWLFGRSLNYGRKMGVLAGY